MNSIYAIEHQIFAARLRLLFFMRLHAKGIIKFVSHDVKQEIEAMRRHLKVLEA